MNELMNGCGDGWMVLVLVGTFTHWAEGKQGYDEYLGVRVSPITSRNLHGFWMMRLGVSGRGRERESHDISDT